MKTKKLLISLVTTSTALLPISVVACGSHSITGVGPQPILQVEKIDTTEIDKTPAYSVDSLRNESLAINNGKVWANGYWRTGFLDESLSQAINLIIALAEEEGCNIDQAINKNPDTYVINDALARQDADSIIASLNLTSKYTSAQIDASRHSLQALAHLAPLNVVNDQSRNLASLTGGNSTIDNSGRDFARFGITSVDQSQYDLGQPLHEQYHTLGWYDTQSKNQTMITTISESIFGLSPNFSSPSPIQFVREVKNKGLAEHYPIIPGDYLIKNILPFIKASLAKFVDEIKDTMDMIKIPQAFDAALRYILAHNTIETTDDKGQVTKTLTFNDQEFATNIQNINNSGAVNLLAIKAMYLGYDVSFTQGGMDLWQSNDWKSNPSLGVGIKDPSFSALAMVMGWAGKTDTLYNPTLSIADNYALNGKKLP